MRIAELYTYPVKGCRRVPWPAAEVEPWGLAGDRRWMVVDDATGQSVTQREQRGLALIGQRPTPDGGLVLTAPHAPDLVVPPPTGAPVPVRVFATPVEATPAGPVADAWLSTVLDRPVRLVWQDDPRRRPADPRYARPGDTVGFADSMPVLLTNRASLDALNDGLDQPVPMTRFRPNLVVDGAAAWAEDGWLGGRLRVGELTFRVDKACGRCVVATVDQDTATAGREPLRALARRRRIGQRLLFGVLLVPEGRGTVRVGDPVGPAGPAGRLTPADRLP